MKKIILTYLTGLFFLLPSCDLELQNDPNSLTPESASLDFVLNSTQYALQEYFFEITEPTSWLTRMLGSGSNSSTGGVTYEAAFQPVSFDDIWELAYTGIMPDLDNIITNGTTRELFTHTGIAKIEKAYLLLTLVDLFGDVPFSEALNPEIFNPKLDPGADVYAEALRLLDDGIADLGKEAFLPGRDLFFEGDKAKWIKLANTLKLRAYLNQRLIDPSGSTAGINAVAGAVMTGSADNWEFRYSKDNTTVPSSRHPWFQKNYNGASAYQSNSYMARFITSRDPRLNYYFYRQVAEFTEDPNEASCVTEARPAHYPADATWCNPGSGYWGRDHLDNDGIPPDNLKRTLFGVYPAGGLFDSGQAKNTSLTDGLGGEGMMPFMQAAYAKFMLAEAALTLGTTGDPKTLLEQAIRQNITEVLAMGASQAGDNEPTEVQINTYVDGVLDAYDDADVAGKLNIINTEYYKAAFGNGVEMMNLYRRTGNPNDMQPALEAAPGDFIRSFDYPNKAIQQNRNVSAKNNTGVQVFWDNNPAGFIK